MPLAFHENHAGAAGRADAGREVSGGPASFVGAVRELLPGGGAAVAAAVIGVLWVGGRSAGVIGADAAAGVFGAAIVAALAGSIWRNANLVLRAARSRGCSEAALRESEERFRQFAENTGDVFWVFSPEHRPRYVSPAYERVWGRSRAALEGSPWDWLDAAHADDRERVRAACLKNAAEGSFDETYRIVPGAGGGAAGGAVRWVRDRRFPVRDSAGTVRHIAGIAEDITPRKIEEARLLRQGDMLEATVRERTAALESANHDLEQKNHEMEQFVYTASHELKSPIVTIQGFLGHLERDVGRGALERLPGFIQRIKDASRRMRESIDDILELSRIGRVANQSDLVDLTAIVHGVVDDHALEIAKRRVDVEVLDLPAFYGDRVRITQVFDNLVANALKYGCGAAEPRVSIGGGSAEDGGLNLYVQDNGAGIAEAYRQRVFGLFERLDKSAEGTGVGLAIVKRIVEMHGGKVWIEASPYGGATFRLWFPPACAAAAAPAASGGVVESGDPEEANVRALPAC